MKRFILAAVTLMALVITVQAGGISGYGPPGSNVANPLTEKDLDAIKKLSSVERAVRRNIGTLKMEFNDIIRNYESLIITKRTPIKFFEE